MRTTSFVATGAAMVMFAAAGAWALHDAATPPDRPCATSEEKMTSTPTPYPALLPASSFVQGASLDLDALPGGADVGAVLRSMRDDHHVNTVGLYGATAGRLPAVLTAARSLNMQVALRVESYDPATFAFRAEDVAGVLADHRAMLEVAARPEHRDRVAYVMLNMPVDDPRVQQRLGGVNSALSKDRQVTYATAMVAALRERTRLPIFVGLFYGWDNGYDVPSYRDAGPDGYVLTNYSYPGDDVSDVINEPRLRLTADRAAAAAGDKSMIVEYGFHTLAHQNGDTPDQVAGLVPDETSKEKAMRITTRFYCDGYPNVIGTMYFGYNTDKVEGSPPRHLDYGLVRTAG